MAKKTMSEVNLFHDVCDLNLRTKTEKTSFFNVVTIFCQINAPGAETDYEHLILFDFNEIANMNP